MNAKKQGPPIQADRNIGDALFKISQAVPLLKHFFVLGCKAT